MTNDLFDWMGRRDDAIETTLLCMALDVRVLKRRLESGIQSRPSENPVQPRPEVALITLAEMERRHIAAVCGRCEMQMEAAAILGLDKSTMSRKLKVLGISLNPRSPNHSAP